METKISVEEIEHYLSDLDNLIETGHFSRESVKDHTFYHKDMVLKEFVSKGREFIRQLLIFTPTASIESEQGKEECGCLKGKCIGHSDTSSDQSKSDTQCMDAEEFFKQRYGHSYNVQFDSIEMIKFATQFASQHKPQIPSEGEIENESARIYQTLTEAKAFQAGAKWALSQTKKLNK